MSKVMDCQGHLLNQHRFNYTPFIEGGIPAGKPLLLPRSPCLGDEERDMDRQKAKKELPSDSGHHSKPSVNSRGPHYSGTHSTSTNYSGTHSNSTNYSGTHSQRSTSTYSLSDSSTTGESRYSPHHTGTQPHRLDPGYTQQLPRMQQYQPQYTGQVDTTNSPQYSDGRLLGTRSQYQGRRPYENYAFPPTTQDYYQSPYEQTMHQQMYIPHPSQYRQVSPTRRHHNPLFKAHSEESFRESYESESQRSFSSLGELPDEAPHYRHVRAPPVRQPPLATEYRHHMEYPGQYLEPSAQYGAVDHSHADMQRLSEGTEAMRIQLQADEIEILKQPIDQTVDLNERVVFSCEARVIRCQEEPNLLWFRNREPLIGEIDSTYIIEETTEKDAGVYHCLVTHPLNAAKTKESYSATLAVNKQAKSQPPLANLPKIVKQPLGRIPVVVGEPFEVSIQVSGDEPLTYQWHRNSLPLQFAQSSVLRFPVTSVTDSGDYCCRVANSHGSILSKVFTLEVTRARATTSDLVDSYLQKVSVAIAQQLRNIENLAYQLDVKMHGQVSYRSAEEHVYQLLKFWKDRKNGTKQQLLSALKQLNIDIERGYSQHNTAKLQITKQPQNTKVVYGQSVSLQVTVANTPASTRYQWFLNRTALVGQNSPRLTISSVVESDVGEYICVVTDKEAKVQSEPAIIELFEAQSQYYHRGAPDPAPHSQSFQPPKPTLIGRGVSLNTEQQPPPGAPCEPKEPQPPKTDVPHNIVITEHPTSVDIEPGDPLTLHCKAKCSEGELKYSWYFNGLLIKEEEQSEYVLNCFTDEDEGFYSCRVSNHIGSVMSDTAQVRAKLDSD